MHKRGHTNQFMKFHFVPVPCPCRHSNKGHAEKMHWRHMQPCVQWALAQTDLLRTYLGNSFFVTQETKSFHPSFHPYDNVYPSMITFVLKTKTPRPRIHSRESWDPGFAYLQTLFMQRWRYIYNIFSPSHINFNTIHFSNENLLLKGEGLPLQNVIVARVLLKFFDSDLTLLGLCILDLGTSNINCQSLDFRLELT